MRLNLSFKFITGCILTLLIPLSITFYLINLGQERLIIKQAENEARAIFRQILITRKWVADHGGVFVEKLPWVEPNPYVNAAASELLDQSGRRFILETPAMVTKELASYAREEGLYWFHITSLRLTNPDNAPDDFERQALQAFEQGSAREYIAMEQVGRDAYLRYISPLHVEESCLPCHPGYELDDVRGAISVTLPLSETFREAGRNRRLLFGAMLAMVALLSGALIFMTNHLVLAPLGKLAAAMQRFSEERRETPEAAVLATGDELEDLSRSFARMAGRLTAYHHGLEEQVRSATRELEASNRRLMAANQLLVSANERKADFIAAASHELRTPLTSIRGAMEYLTARLSQPAPPDTSGRSSEELLEFLELIRKNTDRLIRMVNTMLDLERIETGTASALVYRPFDLGELIRECVVDFISRDDLKGVELLVSGPDSLPLEADEDRIRQVVTNLLDNAIKFAPPDSAITVHCAAGPAEVVVTVTDQGPGIPEAEREKIFAKFYRRGGKEGVGLGLAICRSILEAHGGVIWAATSAGAGGSLCFRLPRRRPAAPPPAPEPRQNRREGS